MTLIIYILLAAGILLLATGVILKRRANAPAFARYLILVGPLLLIGGGAMAFLNPDARQQLLGGMFAEEVPAPVVVSKPAKPAGGGVAAAAKPDAAQGTAPGAAQTPDAPKPGEAAAPKAGAGTKPPEKAGAASTAVVTPPISPAAAVPTPPASPPQPVPAALPPSVAPAAPMLAGSAGMSSWPHRDRRDCLKLQTNVEVIKCAEER